MKKTDAIRILLIFTLFIINIRGQGQSYFTTKGTDFWLAFNQNYFGDTTWVDSVYHVKHTDKMAIYITTDNSAASGTVSIPLDGWSVNYTVPANSTKEIIIPTSKVMCTESDSIEKKGVHVVSDIPVTVYELNYVMFTSDAAIVIPTQSLGSSYGVMAYGSASGNRIAAETSEIVIVAAYDNTRIKITPSCLTVGPGGTIGHPANKPYYITLSKGEVYQIQGNTASPCDLAGTLVELDTTVTANCKKFAVFGGNQCAFIPDNTKCCCNLLVEEMMPIGTWGTQYVTVPLKTRKNDRFRIIASQNGTIITWNGGMPIGLNAGGMYEYESGQTTYIQSNNPISVAQFSESSKTDNVLASDPFMIMLQPLDQSIGKIVYNTFNSKVISNYYINLVTRTAYTSLIKVDGNSVPAAQFTVVANKPSYSYARLNLTQGNHSLESDSGYVANIYGFGDYESYGYIAGATFIDKKTGYDVITPTAIYKYYKVDTICRGTLIKFTAWTNPLITDNYWSFGDGSAIVHGQTVQHTYSKAGRYVITYYYQKSTKCGSDSIVADINIKCCNPHPVIAATTPICVGSNSTIEDTTKFNPNATYSWSFTGGNVISGNGEGPYVVNWAQSGNYKIKVLVTEPSCKADSAFKDITVNPIPTSIFNADTSVCSGQKTSFIYTGDGGANATFNWDFGRGSIQDGSDNRNPTVIFPDSGTYTIKLTVTDKGCTSVITSKNIRVLASPIVSFTANPHITFIDKPEITFADNSTNSSWRQWNFGEQGSGENNYSKLKNTTHSYSVSGDFTVWLTERNKDGCKDSLSLVITILDNNIYYMPNAFVPNEEGVNGIFKPIARQMNYTLLIFDRLGEMISQTENSGWDGKYKGRIVAEGVYVWCLKYSFKDAVEKKAFGHVTVLNR